jgi:hypothetical protein
MSSDLVFYADAVSVLRNNGYCFKETADGFSLTTEGKNVVQFNMGSFSAPFLNAWLLNYVRDVQLFTLGFSKSNPSLRGSLAQYSARFVDELAANGSTYLDKDPEALAIFLSDEIVTDGDNSIHKVNCDSVKVVSRAGFEKNGVVSFFDDEDYDSSTDSEADSSAEELFGEKSVVKKEIVPVPFYYVISMDTKMSTMVRLPKPWKKKIRDDGLSWEFVDGRLYVSNTKGTSYGLPPAPHHICGLPRLKISMENWGSADNIPADVCGPRIASASRIERELTGDTEWEKVTEQFMANPSMETFRIFRDSQIIFDAFLLHKKDTGYKMGSNEKPLSQCVRSIMRGESKAISWQNFTELLHKTAIPNDTKGIMIMLFKIKLYVEQTVDGKVYVSA